MADIWDKAKRSEVMGLIRSKNTKPEIAVRKSLHALGFRYRLHDPRLPGKPDIVLRKHKTVILVQGCFWHAHRCRISKMPSSNVSYWEQKLARNEARDKDNIAALESLGWRVLLIWECSLDTQVREAVQVLRG